MRVKVHMTPNKRGNLHSDFTSAISTAEKTSELMVLVAQIAKQNAQDLVEHVKANELFINGAKGFTQGDFFCLPVSQEFELEGVSFSEMVIPDSQLKLSFKEKLYALIPTSLQQYIKTAFDQVGTIAILEIEPELREYETRIGELLCESNSSIRSVFRKDGEHKGEFRVQSLVYLCGENTTVTRVIENGAILVVDVATVYFSTRLANERMRIARQVEDGEDVYVMFCGVAPQGVIIAKHANPKSVLCVELNPDGIKYALENIRRNKLQQVTAICADVHEYTKTLVDSQSSFDRIVMNLPKSAYEFLDDAFAVAKDNCVLHYYDFLAEDEFALAKQRVSESAQRNGFSVTFNGIHTVGSQGVRTYRICLDCVLRKL